MTTVLIAGLATGAIYAFIALGYNITHLASGALNFAHANLMMLAVFLSMVGLQLGLNAIIVTVAVAIVVGLLALIEERLAIRLLRNNAAHSELVTTLGVASIITGFIVLIWGSDPLSLPAGSWPTGALDLPGGRVQLSDLLMIVVILVIAAALILISRKTKIGISALARSEDREAAQLRGIDVLKLSMFGFALSGVVVGLAAIPIGTKTLAVSSVILILAIKGFVALTLGGVGSMGGAIVGGLFIGLLEAVVERYVGASFRDLIVFAVFLAVLFIRPQGLFGTVRQRVV